MVRLRKFLALALSTMMIWGCSAPAENSSIASSEVPAESSSSESSSPTQLEDIRIAGLKGPTTMGMVHLSTNDRYDLNIYGSADEIVPKLISGELDAAAVPSNLAATLNAKTEGKIKIAAINTLGVLYILENGHTLDSFAELKGKTIYATGQGTTTEYILRHILTLHGIDPDKDVTIEFKSQPSEVAALLASTENAIAMLPEPFVTSTILKNETVRVALDLNDAWISESDDENPPVTGVLVVTEEFANDPEALETLLTDYEESVQKVNGDPASAAVIVGELGIVSERIALSAIAKCSITFLTGDEMKTKTNAHLNVLYGYNPQSIGGVEPHEGLYID